MAPARHCRRSLLRVDGTVQQHRLARIHPWRKLRPVPLAAVVSGSLWPALAVAKATAARLNLLLGMAGACARFYFRDVAGRIALVRCAAALRQHGRLRRADA